MSVDENRPVGWIAYNVDGTIHHFSALDGWDIQCVSTETNPAALLWGEKEFVERTSNRIRELEREITTMKQEAAIKRYKNTQTRAT